MKNVFFCLVLWISIIPLATSQTLPSNSKTFTGQIGPNTKSPVSFLYTEQPATKGKIERPKNYYLANPDGSPAGITESNRFIVKLKDLQHSAGRISLQAKVEARTEQHRKFRDDFEQIQRSNSSARANVKSSKILLEFTRTYNGFAIEGDQAVRDQIRKLSYVESVVDDHKVQAIDLNSSKVIQADRVWSEFNATGKNVNIGIIDTGIDYMHPDLGGGLGVGFKVKGGYDFVNEDSDPMDDHSHGTHVAGIAAANGPGLLGVAPDANLYGYKVLTAEGWGWDSWIIAAIERTVDPDQNPATDDRLHVVNMSLGGPPLSEDPMSEAVNNAVAQGVTFVIAAGNSFDYGTIGTPGVAEKAITVGATDFSDLTAYFSSKGPVQNTFAIKPDVAAPGLDIYSSVLNGQYAVYSGTSMASPHVAGAAALLFEKHPDWTPEIVKGALMATAVNTHNESIWHQGTGRVDVFEAMQSEFVFTPGSISLGLSDLHVAEWIRTQTVTLQNLTETEQVINLSAEGEMVGADISIEITPSSVTLPPHSSQDFDITFTVNTASLPLKDFPQAYTGNVVASSATKTVKSPYAFLHSRSRHLQFTGELPYFLFVIGTNPGNYYWKPIFPQSEMDILLPAGTYDFIAPYNDNYTVVKEYITNEDTTNLVFDKSQADNLITFDPRNNNGNPVAINGWETLGATVFSGPERNFVSLTFGVLTEIHVSDVSAYGYALKIFDKTENDSTSFFDVTLSTPIGITDNISRTNSAEDFSSITFENPSIALQQPQGLTSFMRLAWGWSMFNGVPYYVNNPVKVWVSKHDADFFSVGTFSRFTPHGGGMEWETGVWSAGTDQSIQFSDFWGKDPIKFPTTHYDFRFGKTLPRFSPELLNYDIYFFLADFHHPGYFNRSLFEREIGQIQYEVSLNGAAFIADTVLNRGLIDYESMIVFGLSDPNLYKLRMYYPEYSFNGSAGVLEAEITFDNRKADFTPPFLKTFTIEENGVPTNSLASTNGSKVRLALSDCSGCLPESSLLNAPKLYYKKSSESEWSELTLSTISQNTYEAPIPASSSGLYDMRLFADDIEGNSLSYSIMPAVEVLNYGITLVSPVNNATGVITPVTFSWNPVAGATTYTLKVARDIGFTSQPSSYTVSSTSKTLDLKPGEYYWKVETTVDETSLTSPVNRFLTKKKKVKLLSPQDLVSNQSLTTNFSWTSEDETAFTLDLSGDQAFNTISVTMTASTNSAVVPNLTPGKQYYWRVKPTCEFCDWSDVSTFTTLIPNVTLLPVEQEVESNVDVTFLWDAVEGANNYSLQLSAENDFEPIIAFNQVAATSSTVNDLVQGHTYYWRVGANFPEVTIWSAAESFVAEDILGLDAPAAIKGIEAYPNPSTGLVNNKFYATKATNLSISIINPFGIPVFNENLGLVQGEKVVRWVPTDENNRRVPDGMYIAIVKTDLSAIPVKIILKK